MKLSSSALVGFLFTLLPANAEYGHAGCKAKYSSVGSRVSKCSEAQRYCSSHYPAKRVTSTVVAPTCTKTVTATSSKRQHSHRHANIRTNSDFIYNFYDNDHEHPYDDHNHNDHYSHCNHPAGNEEKERRAPRRTQSRARVQYPLPCRLVIH
ncbi:hypothetical protein BST61_g155 [Cercospora zeina]